MFYFVFVIKCEQVFVNSGQNMKMKRMKGGVFHSVIVGRFYILAYRLLPFPVVLDDEGGFTDGFAEPFEGQLGDFLIRQLPIHI